MNEIESVSDGNLNIRMNLIELILTINEITIKFIIKRIYSKTLKLIFSVPKKKKKKYFCNNKRKLLAYTIINNNTYKW